MDADEHLSSSSISNLSNNNPDITNENSNEQPNFIEYKRNKVLDILDECKQDDNLNDYNVFEYSSQAFRLPEDNRWKIFQDLLFEYKNITFDEKNTVDKFILKINLWNNDELKLFSDLNKSRYPWIKWLSLANVTNFIFNYKKDFLYDSSSNDDVSQFFEFSFPNRLKWFIFNISKIPRHVEDLLDISEYIEYFLMWDIQVLEEMHFYNCKINAHQLYDLITGFSQVKKLWFWWWKFDFSDLKYPQIETFEKNCLISLVSAILILNKLKLTGWGWQLLNNWNTNPTYLYLILQWIIESEVGFGINKVYLDEWDLNDKHKEKISSMFDYESLQFIY